MGARITVVLVQEHRDLLDRRARDLGVSRSEVVRRALDAYLGLPHTERGDLEAFRAAVHATAGSIPRLPSGKGFVERFRSGSGTPTPDDEPGR